MARKRRKKKTREAEAVVLADPEARKRIGLIARLADAILWFEATRTMKALRRSAKKAPKTILL